MVLCMEEFDRLVGLKMVMIETSDEFAFWAIFRWITIDLCCFFLPGLQYKFLM